MTTDHPSEAPSSTPTQSGSTQKKWLIGCGGCLVSLIILAIILVVLGGLGVNKLKEASDQATHNIFGSQYQPDGYTSIGFPLGQKKLKNMALLIDTQRGRTIFAIDLQIAPDELQILKQGNTSQLSGYLRKVSQEMSASATHSSSNRIQDIRLSHAQQFKLPNGKHFPLSNAVIEMEKQGGQVYSPAVVGLIPEINNEVVALIAMSPNDSSSNAQNDFSQVQQSLQTELIKVVQASQLDERLQQ